MHSYDLGECEQCACDAVGHNDDGEYLCEDCLFEWSTKENNKLLDLDWDDLDE